MDNLDTDDEMKCIAMELEWLQQTFAPTFAPYTDFGGFYPYATETKVEHKKCTVNVFIQGDLNNLEGKIIFLTVHDIGKNHKSFINLVNSQPMAPIKERAIFVHVCVPGQQPGATDFLGSFPSMDQIGEDLLPQVLEALNLSKCIAVGEGAGADIVCRFAMKYPKLVLGLVLIHCTSTTFGIIEHIKEILANLRLDDGEMTRSTWNYLLTHRFGNHEVNEQQKRFIEGIKLDTLNEKNLSRYIYSFAHHEDFTHDLKTRLAKVEVLLVTGDKSSHNKNVQHMFEEMTKAKTGLLMAQDTTDVLEEAPDFVAAALILICQRNGIFPDLQLPIISIDNYTGHTGHNHGTATRVNHIQHRLNPVPSSA